MIMVSITIPEKPGALRYFCEHVLNNVNITDSLDAELESWECVPPEGSSLAPGASMTCTGTYFTTADTLDDVGGYVFGTIHNIQADVPPENFIAMWEALQEYGVY